MKGWYVILGILAGAFAGGSGSFLVGAVGGAFIGVLLSRVDGLAKRVRQLESGDRATKRDRTPHWGTQDVPDPGKQRQAWEAGPVDDPGDSRPEVIPEPAPPSAPSNWPEPEKTRPVAGPSLLQTGLQKATKWISTGNVPVKIGIIVTFIGVSFLLKYAIDHELLVVPIHIRLISVAAGGFALMLIGWRLRHKTRVYALNLQGGGAGILFLTIFAAYRIWELLPSSIAFILLVLVTVLTGVLAVVQNFRTLAILGIAGGFLAPVLTSTGQGSHVALFSYYLVLNGAILSISWFRSWRSLNLLGFVFTFFIGTYWGYKYYKPELMFSTMPFLVLHFLFYQAIAILYALRQPAEQLGKVDGSLVFGTPAIVFALQSQLVSDTEYGLAISAAVVAVMYAITAIVLKRKKGDDMGLLSESYIALGVAFATIAIPLALDARWTSAAWALEGAALVWIGMRQQRHLANLAGVALIFLGGGAFLDSGWKSGRGVPVLNGNVLGGVLISISAFFAARNLKAFSNRSFEPLYGFASLALFLWGAAWWLGTGFMEITDRQTRFDESHVFLVFLAGSMAAGAMLGRYRDWPMMRNSTFAMLPIMFLCALFVWAADQHFLFGLGWLAWPMAWVVLGFTLKVADEYEVPLSPAWHFTSLLFVSLMLVLEAYWWTEGAVSEIWGLSVAVTTGGLVALLVWQLRNRPDWPVPAHPLSYLNASIVLVIAQAGCLALMGIADPGDPDPLPYFPLFNPFDLAMIFSIVTTLLSLKAIDREPGTGVTLLKPYKILMATLFFVLTTTALVRGVHHYTGVRWDGGALVDSVIVQTSLSIYWGLLGFSGMILGARWSRRLVWLAGAGFMALVVIKLFLVDLGNTGTVERIVSFMGIGALLLVVGYFAPAPSGKADENLESS